VLAKTRYVKAHTPVSRFDFMVSLRGASCKFRLTASGAKRSFVGLTT
jgi:hypothetical protein